VDVRHVNGLRLKTTRKVGVKLEGAMRRVKGFKSFQKKGIGSPTSVVEPGWKRKEDAGQRQPLQRDVTVTHQCDVISGCIVAT
jgi:hypothetical protein